MLIVPQMLRAWLFDVGRPASCAGEVSGVWFLPDCFNRRSHIVSKMYKYKLGVLLKDLQTTVARCVHCQQYFSTGPNSHVRGA